ncbi:hypothetical protein [Flammeovirga aprica]|uniref:Uncharacterized protein n=1 Tax=Flammeovirga aprica JL-4 TaxID=694437 RepID=A0A7X9S027_9BACT|nr:hypothetical protein [Flammeovirga aprica]NME71873.1 hypothetical protein [Flammeovirga aprica JL-4]
MYYRCIFKLEGTGLVQNFFFDLNEAPIQFTLFNKIYVLKSIEETHATLPESAIYYRHKKAYLIEGGERVPLKSGDLLL